MARPTEEIRKACGIIDGVSNNEFAEVSVNKQAIKAACDRIDARFSEIDDQATNNSLDADIEHEQLERVCEKIIGKCEGMTAEEMADIAVFELYRRLMPDGYAWPHFENGKLVLIGDEYAGTYGTEPVRLIIFASGGEFILYHGKGDPSVGDKFRRYERVKRPQVLAADDEPLEPGQTVYGTRDIEPVEVVDTHSKECGFKSVKCKDDEGFVFYCPDELTHTKPDPPDSWEKWREDFMKPPLDYCERILGKENSHEIAMNDAFTAQVEDMERRAKALSEVKS